MALNFDRLTTFLAAAADLNFTQAARRLHLSQPAVSQQIKELEESLGVTLFERRGRGLLLTPGGDRLRALCRPILREVKAVQSEMSAFRDVPQGVLRVGASNTPGIYMLPFALGAFSARYPSVKVSMAVSDAASILRALDEGDLDLALVEEAPPPTKSQAWERRVIAEDELVLIAPPDHPWAAAGTIGLDALSEGTFIFRPAPSETRQLIQYRLATAGVDPEGLTTRFELGNTEGLKRAVMAGLGVGWVSRFAIGMERESGMLCEVAIRDFKITRPLWLLSPTGGRVSAHHERFTELLLDGAWLAAPARGR